MTAEGGAARGRGEKCTRAAQAALVFSVPMKAATKSSALLVTSVSASGLIILTSSYIAARNGARRG